eukprot:3392285-Prymnesium_polylepis.1
MASAVSRMRSQRVSRLRSRELSSRLRSCPRPAPPPGRRNRVGSPIHHEISPLAARLDLRSTPLCPSPLRRCAVDTVRSGLQIPQSRHEGTALGPAGGGLLHIWG